MSSIIRAQKSALRSQLRASRRDLTAAQRTAFDGAINSAVLEWARVSSPNRMAAFWAFDCEPDLLPALTQMDQAGIVVMLPVVQGNNHNELIFQHWTPSALMTENSFGIAEPRSGEVVEIGQLDQIFVPLVGWSAQGDRLGMGSGFYDRVLATVAPGTRPRRTGIAYGCQETQDIPLEPWDQPLDDIITENGRLSFIRDAAPIRNH